jgi:hypothetical protein
MPWKNNSRPLLLAAAVALAVPATAAAQRHLGLHRHGANGAWDLPSAPFRKASAGSYAATVEVENLDAAAKALRAATAGRCDLKKGGASFQKAGGGTTVTIDYSCEAPEKTGEVLARDIKKLGQLRSYSYTPDSFDAAIEMADTKLAPLKAEYEGNRSAFAGLPIAASLMEEKLGQLDEARELAAEARAKRTVTVRVSLKSNLGPDTPLPEETATFREELQLLLSHGQEDPAGRGGGQ